MKTLEQLAREAGGVLMFAGDDEQPAEFNMTTADLARFRAACRAEALEEAAQEFDQRDKGVGGFYDPHEPAKIIRGLK